jgi:ParB/RepB/Spo0J family partition protein
MSTAPAPVSSGKNQAENFVGTVGAVPVMYVDISPDGNVYIDEELNNRYIENTEVEEDEIANLAASIDNVGGLLQPIVVYKTLPERRTSHGKDYELNSGFRRSKALKKLAESTENDAWITNVPAMVFEHAPAHQRKLTQLMENLQRKDLSPMEIATSFKEVIDSGMFTQKQLADQVGYPAPTVSNFIKAAGLCPEVQTMIHRAWQAEQKGESAKQEGMLSWSAGKALSQHVARLNMSKEQQIEAAKVGSAKHVNEFVKFLDETFGPNQVSTGNTDDATTTTTPPDQSQRKPPAAKRANELKDKYLPKLQEQAAAAGTKDKVKWEARVDALKWVLNQDGTTIGAELSPWEEELKAKAEAEEKTKEEERLRTKYINQAAMTVKKILTTLPPIDAAVRTVPTLPEALAAIKQDVIGKLERGKQVGQPDGYMEEGFAPGDVDAFINLVSAKYTENENAAKKRKADSDAKKLAEAEKEKAAAEAAKNGEASPATAVTAAA